MLLQSLPRIDQEVNTGGKATFRAVVLFEILEGRLEIAVTGKESLSGMRKELSLDLAQLSLLPE